MVVLGIEPRYFIRSANDFESLLKFDDDFIIIKDNSLNILLKYNRYNLTMRHK